MRRSRGRRRRDLGQDFLQPANLGAQLSQLRVEPGNLSRTLLLHPAPFLGAVLPDQMPELGLGQDLLLLLPGVLQVAGLVPEPLQIAVEHVRVAPELLHHLYQPALVVAADPLLHRRRRPGASAVQPFQPVSQPLPGGQQNFDLRQVVPLLLAHCGPALAPLPSQI